mmetsp:Transcript_3720/g.12027  ORF Transcript_3720/g.12027 Transcript_3720/m.12027 type:complete len:240 (+) Transcript_3720:1792-2511(+)
MRRVAGGSSATQWGHNHGLAAASTVSSANAQNQCQVDEQQSHRTRPSPPAQHSEHRSRDSEAGSSPSPSASSSTSFDASGSSSSTRERHPRFAGIASSEWNGGTSSAARTAARDSRTCPPPNRNCFFARSYSLVKVSRSQLSSPSSLSSSAALAPSPPPAGTASLRAPNAATRKSSETGSRCTGVSCTPACSASRSAHPRSERRHEGQQYFSAASAMAWYCTSVMPSQPACTHKSHRSH